MMPRAFWFATISSLMAAGVAHAGSYKLATLNPSVGMFYDLDTMKKSGDTATVWVVKPMSEIPMVEAKSIKAYLMIHEAFACKAETVMIASASSYRLSGENVTTDSNYDLRPEQVVPDSMASDVMKVVCIPAVQAATIGNSPAEVVAKFRIHARSLKR